MDQPVQTIPVEAMPVQTLPVQGMPPGPGDAVQRVPESPTRMKYMALLWGLMIVAATTVVLYFVSSARSSLEGFSSVFQPKVKYNTVLSGAIGQLNNTPKLVVLTADLQITVTTESITTGWWGVPLGSATAEITAPAKVQYYVPVKELNVDDFYYDESGKRLVVKIPRPILDTDVVYIESNPDKMAVRLERGWSPLSAFKQGSTLAEAKRNLKEAAIQQGRHELLTDRAEKNAKEIVAEQMSKVSKAIKEDGLRLEVEFRSSPK